MSITSVCDVADDLCAEVKIYTSISYHVNRKMGELPQILYLFQGSLLPKEMSVSIFHIKHQYH